MTVIQQDMNTLLKEMIRKEIQSCINDLKDELKKDIINRNKGVLTMDDVIELTKMKRSSIYNYMSKGLISYYRPNSKHVYFKLQDIINFIFNKKYHRKSKIELKQEALQQYLKK